MTPAVTKRTSTAVKEILALVAGVLIMAGFSVGGWWGNYKETQLNAIQSDIVISKTKDAQQESQITALKEIIIAQQEWNRRIEAKIDRLIDRTAGVAP